LGNELAQGGGDRRLRAFRIAELGREGGNLEDRTTRLVIDDLGVHMVEAATHTEARTLGGAGRALADPLVAGDARLAPDFRFIGEHCCFLDSEGRTDAFRPGPSGSLSLLDFLLDDDFVRVANTLALVGLGRTVTADRG